MRGWGMGRASWVTMCGDTCSPSEGVKLFNVDKQSRAWVDLFATVLQFGNRHPNTRAPSTRRYSAAVFVSQPHKKRRSSLYHRSRHLTHTPPVQKG